MARYISQWASFKKKVVAPVYTIVQGPSGPVQTLSVPAVIAIFSKQGVTEQEKELALERFRFKGVAEGEDPIRRVSSYDTDQEARTNAWSDAMKAEIERVLDLGQGVDYFRVEKPAAVLPWPTYDKNTVKEIKTIVMSSGIDPNLVLDYERENRNRPEVLNLFEAEEDTAVGDEITVNA